MEILVSNGWTYSRKGCSCAGSPPIYVKGNFKIAIVRGKSFKLYDGAKLKMHRRINELEDNIKNL